MGRAFLLALILLASRSLSAQSEAGGVCVYRAGAGAAAGMMLPGRGQLPS